jgi:phage-related holin
MINFGTFKLGVSFVSSMGVMTVITNVIRHTTPSDLTKFQRAFVGIGGYVLSSIITNIVTNHIDAKLDDLAQSIKNTIVKAEPEVIS